MPQQSLIAVSPVSQDLLFTPDASFDIGQGANRPRNITASNNITAGGSFLGGGSAIFSFSGRSRYRSPTDGVITLLNNAETDFNRLQFGGTTAAFPSWKRSGASIQARAADDSGFIRVDVSVLVTATIYTVATLPVGANGMRAFVSDSTVAAAGNFGAAVAGGGADTVPVYYDGAWRIG